MKALVFNGPRDIRYESYPDPELATQNSVILKVDKCSICGSDLHMYHGENIGKADYSQEIPKFCVGHEFIGEVVDAGPHVHAFKTGDKVLAAGGTGCGNCPACRTGSPLACRKATAFGLSAELNGGQAEYINIPNADQTLSIIPEGISQDQAMLLTDAMGTAHYGMSRANIQSGADIAIVGLGPIGLIGVELAFLMGASRVFAIDPVKERRDHAAKLGAKALTPEESAAHIQDATKGKGTSSVFEASGAKAAVNLTLKIAGQHSTISFIGIPHGGAALDMVMVLFKDITIRAGIADIQGQWKYLVPLLQSGRLKADGLFSHRMDISEGAEAYRLFDAREDGVVKIMMDI